MFMATNNSSLNRNSQMAAQTGAQGIYIHIPMRLIGFALLAIVMLSLISLASWSVSDPSLSFAAQKPVENILGTFGAVLSDILFQFFGIGALFVLIAPTFWSWRLIKERSLKRPILRIIFWFFASIIGAGVVAFLPAPTTWPLPTNLGGLIGDGFVFVAEFFAGGELDFLTSILYFALILIPFIILLFLACGFGLKKEANNIDPLADEKNRFGFLDIIIGAIVHAILALKTAWIRAWHRAKNRENQIDKKESTDSPRQEPSLVSNGNLDSAQLNDEFAQEEMSKFDPIPEFLTKNNDNSARLAVESTNASNVSNRVGAPPTRPQMGKRQKMEAKGSNIIQGGFELPSLDLLTKPKINISAKEHQPQILEEKARQLESVLADFGVKGDIVNVRPGPVVTLYELEPAPGVKSSRVISLADDIARSMATISARIAVVPGRNAIGIELPNQQRETVYLREMLASKDFEMAKGKLNICLGKTIGGEPVIADLARMPHLLVAGTTGSGKSVAINTMILSLLYRMTPEQCRLIMIDPKMLELSVYDGIPHLLSPVVTDPTKAVVALKWAVREMEDRYRKMSKIGVRNIESFNKRVNQAIKRGETITRTVQTGFDKETGEPIYESESFELEPLPFIVIIVDEMADLMMVAGKDIEGAIQRLAQMARAAGIHLITATQRPSVDVITGTIKANFPTRISFQVTSKIDSRTILGEMGAEQLLGMGDMLYMAGGGRTSRLHGPFCSDKEVEDVVAHLKAQGVPDYLESVTQEVEEEGTFSEDGQYSGSGNELYDKAVNIVLNDKKASISYIQRRLSIGYNRAASLIEKMEQEGIVSPAGHNGKREILVGDGVDY